jgi:nitrate/nitrite transporter NarK
MGMTEVEAAKFVSYAAFIRVGGAITAGLLADRFKTSNILILTFLSLVISFFFLSVLNFSEGAFLYIYANILITFFSVNALRGIYFALLEESQIETHKTGTAVGLISAIGYTPDIFFYSISARIIAASPGIEGYHDYFFFMTITVLVGMVTTWFFVRHITKTLVKEI